MIKPFTFYYPKKWWDEINMQFKKKKNNQAENLNISMLKNYNGFQHFNIW